MAFHEAAKRFHAAGGGPDDDHDLRWSPFILCQVVHVLAEHRPCCPRRHIHGENAVIPGNSYLVAAERVEIRVCFEPGDATLSVARRVIAEALAGSFSRVDRDVAVLLIDEVTANAECHAGGALEVVVRATAASVSVEVTDADPASPVLKHPDYLAEGGRGMWLVDQLAQAWGYRHIDGNGKVVWFEIDADSADTPSI